MNGCKVRMWQTILSVAREVQSYRCGDPVVAHGLCEKHYADRLRLGGAA